jgi:hypothetical protein
VAAVGPTMALVRPPEAAASAGGVGKDAPERAPSRPWGNDGRGRLRILMLTAEPPSATARGGRPQVTNAALVELAKRHDVTLVTQAGGDPADAAAIAAWAAAGAGSTSSGGPGCAGWRCSAAACDSSGTG